MNPTENSVAFGAPGIEPRCWSHAEYVSLVRSAHDGFVIEFTFFWKEAQRWEGRNYSVTVNGPKQ